MSLHRVYLGTAHSLAGLFALLLRSCLEIGFFCFVFALQCLSCIIIVGDVVVFIVVNGCIDNDVNEFDVSVDKSVETQRHIVIIVVVIVVVVVGSCQRRRHRGAAACASAERERRRDGRQQRNV